MPRGNENLSVGVWRKAAVGIAGERHPDAGKDRVPGFWRVGTCVRVCVRACVYQMHAGRPVESFSTYAMLYNSI